MGGLMSKVLSIRLKDDQVERLHRFARRVGKKPSELASQLVEEALRREEFPGIDIRETAAGQAFIGGTRLKVWHVAVHARDGQSAAEIASSLGFRESQISVALAYASRYADEIDAIIEDNHAAFERLFPEAGNYRVMSVDAATP
jgi:uncharacterized protein (DUF433 family)